MAPLLIVWHWLLHYTGISNSSGRWYAFWSGIFSDVTIFGGALVLMRKHNCHVKGCLSVVTHHDPEVQAPACHRHHSHAHRRGTSRAQ